MIDINKLDGAKDELDFWAKFVKTDRFIKQWLSDDITHELLVGQPSVVSLFQKLLKENPDLKVLDVGSGVYSILKGLVPVENIDCVDPLGDFYKNIFNYEEFSLKAPLARPAEDIPWVEMYDVVHMRNALDHTQNPDDAFEALMRSVKKGGYVIIHGFTNEAYNENWKGFHQWNIDLDNQNTIVCEGKKGPLFALKSDNDLCSKYKLDTGKEWFVWIFQK